MISKPLSVLHVYRTYFPDSPGGLQEAIRQICLAVQPHGVVNTIFTLSVAPDPERLERVEASVVRGRSWAAPASCDLGGVATVARFRQLAAEADVIHYHFPWPFADLLRLLAKPSTPSILTYHSDIVRQRFLGGVYRPMMMRTLGAMSAVVATSPAYARSSKVLGHDRVRDRVRVIPLGIVEHSYPRKGDEGIFAKLAIAPFEPFMLFIGVLRYYKGLEFLIRAALNVNSKVVIAGFGPESYLLQEYAKTLGAHNVIFAGQVSEEEKLALLRRCRALVLPSHLRSEAFGMVLVEAAMFGKPMISCEIGTGTSFVNLDGETGFVVQAGRPDVLASAMNRILSDDATAVRLGRAARARYERCFSGEALGREYVALYREAVDGMRTSS